MSGFKRVRVRVRKIYPGVTRDIHYLGVIDKWLGYAETVLEEANRKDFQQVHWAEHTMVITFERHLKKANTILEEIFYRDTFEPESEFPESYEQSAPLYTPRSNIPSIIEELEEEEDFLPSFPVPPSMEVASVSDLADYPSRLPASHDASDQSGTDKSESRRNRRSEERRVGKECLE